MKEIGVYFTFKELEEVIKKNTFFCKNPDSEFIVTRVCADHPNQHISIEMVVKEDADFPLLGSRDRMHLELK